MSRDQGFGNLVRGGREKGGFEDVEPRRRIDVGEAQKIVVVAWQSFTITSLGDWCGKEERKKREGGEGVRQDGGVDIYYQRG